MYKVFTRAWWRDNPKWPNGLEPHAGPKRTICYASTEREAREICQDYNDMHDPGPYSYKAEYENA